MTNEEFNSVLTAWHEALWAAQLEFYPDSKMLTPNEAFRSWCCGSEGQMSGVGNLVTFAATACYPGGVFYECGCWRGYRFGLEDSKYLSGFDFGRT